MCISLCTNQKTLRSARCNDNDKNCSKMFTNWNSFDLFYLGKVQNQKRGGENL